jgi:hypothetical protein
MESFISSELIAKLREEQRSLRHSIHALESQVREAGQRANLGPLIEQFSAFRTLYQSHERLVGALLEAVEPDDPSPQARDEE